MHGQEAHRLGVFAAGDGEQRRAVGHEQHRAAGRAQLLHDAQQVGLELRAALGPIGHGAVAGCPVTAVFVVPPTGFWSHVRYVTDRALNRQMLRWFDHWLKDNDTGVMDEPPVLGGTIASITASVNVLAWMYSGA